MVDLSDARANASPTKAFFVTMITRDISLEDCILDLLDNSVDGALRKEGGQAPGLGCGPDLSSYHIHVFANAEIFSIRDNSGGMTLDDAADHAFTFGRSNSSVHEGYSIGVYGIGMKRAIFKIGREIRVRSTVQTVSDGKLSFAVPIDVDAWLSDDSLPWDFDIVSDDTLLHDGVEIDIKRVNPAISNSFDNPLFMENLIRMLSRDYSLHLARGLKLSVNGNGVNGIGIKLLESDEYAPVRIKYADVTGSDTVDVEIIGGMAASPPDQSDPTENDDTDRWMGWYVACNGRIVLSADKTPISGWGTEDWPSWHRQYSGFVGIILFTSERAAALPLTTTKRSVDVTSEVWRRARSRMREVTKDWISYTNQRKQMPEGAREREARARPVDLEKVSARPAVVLPRLTPKVSEKVGNVNYSMPVTKLKKLASSLGNLNMSYRDVGIKSFEYTYDDLTGDE